MLLLTSSADPFFQSAQPLTSPVGRSPGESISTVPFPAFSITSAEAASAARASASSEVPAPVTPSQAVRAPTSVTPMTAAEKGAARA